MTRGQNHENQGLGNSYVQAPHNPNLLTLKISLPMWTNEEIKLEIKELYDYIQMLEVAGKDPTYYEDKMSILQQALKVRG